MLRRVRFYNVGKADYNFIKKEELVVYKHFRGEHYLKKTIQDSHSASAV